ncbi:CheR family methyltransferase [Bordetella genomosp. 10]|nr:protein-glutamate O-methyltransferase CheR [Bordetella genomosp. 10]
MNTALNTVSTTASAALSDAPSTIPSNTAPASAAPDMGLKAAFNDLLKQRIGLDAAAIGQAAIDRAVRQRAQACSGGDAAAYWRLLAGSREEQQQLIETVVVPETSFFRHGESMDTLAVLARRQLADGRRLRLLSLPCSSGEEAYTLAMALLDAGVDANRFSVTGVDVSARLIQHARHGVYGRNSFRGDALGFRARHFNDTEAGYSVLPRVRADVAFQTGNLLDPMLDLPPASFDFVFCRNLLIYFDEATQRAAVDVLVGLARPDGYLFVGPAEASLLTRMGLRQVEAAGAFAFHREAPAPARSQPSGRLAQHSRAGARTYRGNRAGAAFLPAARTETEAGASRPGAPRGAGMAGYRGHAAASPRPGAAADIPAAAPASAAAAATAESLAAVQALADSGRIAAALEAGARHLERHGASAPAYYLIGLLHDASGASAAAEAAYRKALYLEPEHHEALLHLASLAEARGDAAAAGQLRQRAARAGARHV